MAKTLTAAHAAVFAAVTGLSGFGGILDHEVSPDQMPTGDILTVSLAGKSSTEYNVFVRVWCSAATDQDGAAAALDLLTEEVEVALPTAFVVGEWTVLFSDDHLAWVAQSIVSVPREDL